MRKGDKRGQFYLIAAIIISGILIAIFYASNYFVKKTSYNDGKEIAEELRIELQKVSEYWVNHPLDGEDSFNNFVEDFSNYARDKDIYFIIIDKSTGEPKVIKHTDGTTVYPGTSSIVGNEIRVELYGGNYVFPLENGENIYSIIIYDKGGERYVYTI